ncbi:MAG: hypothetical protein N2749_05360 [Clostridia bacterium]|nr:hypothetical protein [Clostridia bacterium]
MKIKNIILSVMLIILFLNINYNAFNIFSENYKNSNFFVGKYDEKWFEYFQSDSETLVISKLMQSEKEGVFSNAGLLTVTNVDGVPNLDVEIRDIYKNGTDKTISFSNYTSQVGFQGIIMGKIANFLSISNENVYNLFRTILSLLFALVLFGILYYIYDEFGVIACVAIFFVCLFSPYLNAFGKNLYWVAFTWFLPMLSMIMLLRYFEKKNIKYNNILVAIVIFILVFIKTTNGNEYITTIGISMIVPLVYYAIKNSWKLKDFITRTIIITIAALLGFCTQIIIWIIQLRSVLGSFPATMDLVKLTIVKRIGTSASSLGGIIDNNSSGYKLLKESMEANVFDVIGKYLVSPIFPFMNSLALILIFFIFLFVFFIFRKKIKETKDYRKCLAINISTLFSLTAPLSWYILAKGHSYVHTHMNHVLWYLPFAILVPASIVLVIKCSCEYFKSENCIKKKGVEL